MLQNTYNFDDLEVDKLLTKIKDLIILNIEGLEKYSPEVILKLSNGNELVFYHEQDCCESVSLEDFEISSKSLIGSKILDIELRSDRKNSYDGSETWCFYNVKTTQGDLWLRFHGSSNGYYSEWVDLAYYNPVTTLGDIIKFP